MKAWANPKTGVVRYYLNPAEKGKKYADELRNNRKITNDFKTKTDKNGKSIMLNKEDRQFRIGYLNARKDSANCYKANKAKKKSNSKKEKIK